MISITNMRFGKKIGLVLGGIIFLLAGLSVLSLWGIQTNERLATTLVQRLTKARLAEKVDSDTLAVAMNLGRIVIDKKVTEDLANRISARKKDLLESAEQFKVLADTPTSIKQGGEMVDLVQAASPHSKAALELAFAGRFAEASKELHVYYSAAQTLRDKCREAADFQLTRTAEAEKTNKETASTIWLTLILGSLAAVILAVIGGIVLTRSIAVPLTIAVAHLGEVAKGNLSKDAPAEFQARGDEIGLLARAKQLMIVNLRQMVAASPVASKWCPPRRRNCRPIRVRCRPGHGRPRTRPIRWPRPPSR